MTKAIQILLVTFSVALGVIVTPTLAHHFYSQYCCNEVDCKPVPCDLIVETDKGVSYFQDGIKYDIAKEFVYPSQDRNCHVCILGGNGRCAYIQQGV